MNGTEPLTDEAGEVRELEAEDMARMRPLAQVVPELADLLTGTQAERPA